MITLPEGYRPRFPDSETVVLDMCQPELDRLTPSGTAVTWWPLRDTTKISDGFPLVRVHKVPGKYEAAGHHLNSNVQISVLTGRRDDSWTVLGFVGDELFRKFEHGGRVDHEDGSFTMVRGFDVAPVTQQIPDLNPDHRVVQTIFTVTLRRRA